PAAAIGRASAGPVRLYLLVPPPLRFGHASLPAGGAPRRADLHQGSPHPRRRAGLADWNAQENRGSSDPAGPRAGGKNLPLADGNGPRPQRLPLPRRPRPPCPGTALSADVQRSRPAHSEGGGEALTLLEMHNDCIS